MVKADTEFLMYLNPAILHTIFISFILSQSYGLIELDANSTLNLGREEETLLTPALSVPKNDLR